MRGIRAAEHRSLPTREESHDCRTPEVEVAGNHRGPTVGGQLRADVAHVRDRPRVPELRRRVQPDDVDAVHRRPTRCTRSRCARSAWSRNTSPIGSSRQSRTGSRVQTASSQPPAGRTSPARHVRDSRSGEVRRAHRRSPRLRAGRGGSFRLRSERPPVPRRCRRRTRARARRRRNGARVDTSPADSPMGVERGDGERGADSDADALREQLAVVRRVAEEDLRRLRPLEVQVRGVLPREADATVDLDVLGGRVEVRLGAVRLRRARRPRGARRCPRRRPTTRSTPPTCRTRPRAACRRTCA